MASNDGRDTDGKPPGKSKSLSIQDTPIEGEDESSDLVLSIKEEPMDEDYYEPFLNSNGETCEGPTGLHQDIDTKDDTTETRSDHFDEIPNPNVDVTQPSVVTKTKTALLPCVPAATVPNGGGIRITPIKASKSLPSDLLSVFTSTPVVASTRLLPISLKTSCPIPIALTVNTPEVNPKTTPSTVNSQTSAHHLMTLATEADKILKRQKKTSEKGTNSDHTDDEKLSNSEEDNLCTSDSSGGMDSYLNPTDLTMTLIQRRAAEASLSASKSKKTKRKRSQLPDDMKDQTYWERRRKNNEAAKRSRDARRAKEDQIAIRAALLEQENMRLKIEVAALKEETVKLRGMLYDKR